MIDFQAIEPPAIVVTASRAEESISDTPASVTVIDEKRIERLGAPSIPELLRLVPSVAVGVSGPAGSLTQVRIRGAEANHSLLFVEGIRANDPASGNEPRFELLNADLASRIEIVRGPQSALWGSEAIGGVVAVSGPAPGAGGSQAFVEGGSHSTWRGAGRTEAGDADGGISIGIAGQRSDGIDSFDGDGDRDGYYNYGLRMAGRYRAAPSLLIGTSGFAIKGKSEFDGFLSAFPFPHGDTLDKSRTGMAAGRLFAEYGQRETSYAIASAGLLGSSNRNYLDDEFLNKTTAHRRTLSLEGGHRLGKHQLIGAIESERETFEARGNYPNQDQARHHESLTLEWRAADIGPVSGGVAVRHDIFSRFKDATSIRASLRADVGHGISLAASYGDGISQPTFFDLFGFSPDRFVGNPALKPESSRGGEVSLRYATDQIGGALTYFHQRLKDEIATIFLPDFTSTAINAEGKSKRQGVELEGYYQPWAALRLTVNYAWLDASEPQVGGGQLRETRRPKHSGSVALDGAKGRLSYGAAIAYTGERTDDDFDFFPAESVRLDAYWLASAKVAYRLTDRIEAHLRVANAFDDDYQDVFGYRTEGRSVFGGLRVALGD
ncbi:TonB-dependent receptor [Sphingomonas sp. RB56-2]|uniref:TonB-dependent receptor n=1 Tax=Sphingomonas brevis TaxID=2908206 RepID=A0ABT0S7C8_9SPHN|nr:TonB-dependent receptor [Sphingomonas brevis]MCL6740296.1 TonB-dependent receptor [Sphingomonas brevis]